MRFQTIYILILIFCITSCSNEKSNLEDSAESQTSETQAEEIYEDEETDENEYEDNVAEERSAPTASVSYNNQAPRIKTINIESISNDLRSGFRAVNGTTPTWLERQRKLCHGRMNLRRETKSESM